MNDTTDRISAALHHLAETTRITPDLDSVLDDAVEPADRRTVGPRRGVTAILVAALLGTTGVTAAISAGGFTSEDGLDADVRTMAEFPEVAAAFRDEVPFAPGASFGAAVDAIAASSEDPGTQISVEGMTDMVANAAMCSWLESWRVARLESDAEAAARAVAAIDEARRWPWALVNRDFQFRRLTSHAAALRAGDDTYVAWELGRNCLPVLTDVPHVPPTGPTPPDLEEPTNWYGQFDD